jgi:hypothetical protein
MTKTNEGCLTKFCILFRDYAGLPTQGMVLNFAGLFVLIFAATVITLVYDFRFRRRPRPEGEMLLSDGSEQ